MARSFDMQLTNSRGLGKLIFCSGLKFPVVIVPSLMGERVITEQPFYFLERMESVARVRFEKSNDVPTEREIEYIVDNYLFEISKQFPDLKLSSKVSEYQYWRDDPEYHYHMFDWRLVECLVLDTLNDDSILECSDENHPRKEFFYDWCFAREHCQEALEEYRSKLSRAMSTVVEVAT